MSELRGDRVVLRRATEADLLALAAIRATPEVRARWGDGDFEAELRDAIDDDELELWAIRDDGGRVIGAIQSGDEEDPMYRHATLDLFLDPACHGRGLGPDAIRTLVRHLFDDEDHHRLTIDPAADNLAAIRAYTKVGFREVGRLRQYERGPDGRWHDGLLMELLRDDFERDPSGR